MKKPTRYYVFDLVENELTMFASKKDFFDSLLFNFDIAKECGDKLPKRHRLINRFTLNEDENEVINAFHYMKLTKDSLKDYNYGFNN